MGKGRIRGRGVNVDGGRRWWIGQQAIIRGCDGGRELPVPPSGERLDGERGEEVGDGRKVDEVIGELRTFVDRRGSQGS